MRACVRAGRLAALLVATALAGCAVEPAPPAGERAVPVSPPVAIDAPARAPARLAATVARVGDGDSLVVALAAGGSSEVRLHGIDAPELGQAWGREARDHLRQLAAGQRVALEVKGVDPYGRQLAVAIAGAGDLGELQIAGGHAWHNVRYADEQAPAVRQRYAAAERAARDGRRGLWGERAPVAPWDFKARQRAGADVAGTAANGTAAEATGRGPAAGPEPPIIGNRRSGIYHLRGCAGYRAVSPRNAVPFASEQAARAAGYRRSSSC
jgi:endonuclease YncB( thermonuclease family)